MRGGSCSPEAAAGACASHWDEGQEGVKEDQPEWPSMTRAVCLKPHSYGKQTVQFTFVSNVCTQKCSHHARVADWSESTGYYDQHIHRRMWMDSGGVKRNVSKEGGHATEVVQLKVYRPLRPSISGSVDEKCCHIENE